MKLGLTSERDVLDLVMRYSSATSIAEIGPVTICFERHVSKEVGWLETAAMRQDIEPDFPAEEVQAFAIQSRSLNFAPCTRLRNSKTG